MYPNAHYSVEGNEVKRHVSLGSFGALATSSYDASAPVAETAYHHRDHLGGTHVDTDAAGSALEYALYAPFGASVADWRSGSYENDRKFTGKELDQDTGWHYYGSRYYASGEGRFLSEDPVFLGIGSSNEALGPLRDPQVLNSYAYARNNPVAFVDPDGEFVFPVIAALAAVTWAGVETALSAYDAYDTAATLASPDSSISDKAVSAGGFALGLVAPGGGYGALGKKADDVAGAASSGEKLHTVYQSVKDGVVQYVGRTVDFGRRLAEHLREKGMAIEKIPGLDDLTKDAARGVEQRLIEQNGLGKDGGTLINQINGISASNPRYDELTKLGDQTLENRN